MAKSKTHKVVVSVTFSEPVTKAEAAHAFRECVYGEFCPEQGTFKIRSVKPFVEPPKETEWWK